MNLPFTSAQFFEVFSEYNQVVWPAQLALIFLALMSIALAMKKYWMSELSIGVILAFFWFWMGIVYHILFFAVINPAAYLFGSLFILQGLLFIYYVVIRKAVVFQFHKDSRGWVGGLLMLYALVIYPVLGYTQGHSWPNTPTFGLPCPTTIFTFGLLLWTEKRIPLMLVVIPLIWSVIGTSAAFTMGVKQDFGLIVSGVVFVVMLYLVKTKNSFKSET
jgi:Family of unknown function (DUF6064)